MKRLATFLIAGVVWWQAPGCGGSDPRQIAYDSLGPTDKACLGTAWRSAPVFEGRVTIVDGSPYFQARPGMTGFPYPDARVLIWPLETVVLREAQPLAMVCFEDCSEGILGPNCRFVDVPAERAVGAVVRY